MERSTLHLKGAHGVCGGRFEQWFYNEKISQKRRLKWAVYIKVGRREVNAALNLRSQRGCHQKHFSGGREILLLTRAFVPTKETAKGLYIWPFVRASYRQKR